MSYKYLYILLTMLNLLVPNGVLSTDNHKSLSYSLGISSDNQNITIEEVVDSKILKANFNISVAL